MEYCDEILLELSFLQKDKILLFHSFHTRQVLRTFGYFYGPSVYFLSCRDRNRKQSSRCSLTISEESGMITPLPLLVALWLQSGIWLAFIAAVLLSWLLFHQDPRVPFSNAVPQPTDLNLYWAFWLFCARCRTLHFLLLKFMLFLTSHPSSLSRSVQDAHPTCTNALKYLSACWRSVLGFFGIHKLPSPLEN